MSAHTEPLAGIAREGAHIGTRGALDDHVNVDHSNGAGGYLFAWRVVGVGLLEDALGRARGRQDFQARNTHRARRQFDVLTRTGEGIGTLAVHLDRRNGRRHLHDVPTQRRERGFELILAQRLAAHGCGRDTFCIVCVGSDAKTDRRPIFL